MDGEPMRRRPVFFLALAVLAVALAAAGTAAAGPDVTVMKLGSTFTVTGRTGSAPGKHTRAVGPVRVFGRWNGGTWHVISMTRTDQAGNYVFRLTPQQRGNLTLRIATPDHRPRRLLLHVY